MVGGHQHVCDPNGIPRKCLHTCNVQAAIDRDAVQALHSLHVEVQAAFFLSVKRCALLLAEQLLRGNSVKMR